VSGRIEGVVAPGPRRHGAASDQAEADRGNRRRDDAGGYAVQDFSDEDEDECGREGQDERRCGDGDNADCGEAAFPRHPIDERSARQMRDKTGDGASKQSEPDLFFVPAQIR
jgi:hypothetical protein